LSNKGKCRELSIAACKENNDLILVQGYYHCPFTGKNQHWWTKDDDGVIHDPTKDQFAPLGEYEEIKFPRNIQLSMDDYFKGLRLNTEGISKW